MAFRHRSISPFRKVHGPVVGELFEDRLRLVAPALAAQITAGLEGMEAHTSRHLGIPECKLRRDFALHYDFSSGERPSTLSAPVMRRRQRRRKAITSTSVSADPPEPAGLPTQREPMILSLSLHWSMWSPHGCMQLKRQLR